MDIDNAEDTWSSRGQKRKREMSGDILARHSQPKLRRVEVSDEQGPPLSCKVAAADGDADPLRIVITGEFNIDTINEWECTALEIAALGGSAEAIGLLLKEGAQIGQVNNQGRTPLHMAAGNGQTETIGLLLKEGAQIGQVDNDGNTHCI
jgi:ankyrin repeat protein